MSRITGRTARRSARGRQGGRQGGRAGGRAGGRPDGPLLAAGSAALFVTALRPGPLGPLVVVAFALYLASVRAAPSARSAAVRAVIAASGPCAVAASPIAPLSPLGSAVATGVFAGPFALAGTLAWWAHARRGPFGGIAFASVAALAWCAVEAAWGSVVLLGVWAMPALAIGTAFVDGPLLGLAAWVGVRGLSLVAALLGGLLVLVSARLRRAGRATPVVLAAGAIAGVSFTLGGATPRATADDVPAPAVAVVPLRIVQHAPTPQSIAAARLHPATRRAHERFLREHALGAGSEGRLVVWPEATLSEPWSGGSSPRPTSLPPSADTLFGAATQRGGRMYNSALLWHDGDVRIVADKRHLVPFTESALTPGELRAPTPWRSARIAALLCWEAAFPQAARRAAREGATLLAVLANDAYADRGPVGALHLRMARLRAVETGLPIVFAQATGPSAAIAADGRVVARIAAGRAASLDVELPSTARVTLYRRTGDLVGPGSMAGCLALFAWRGRWRGRRPGRRRGRRPAPSCRPSRPLEPRSPERG